MLGKIAKLIGIIAVASWAISSSALHECGVFSTSEVFGADKSAGPALKAGQKHWIGRSIISSMTFDKRPQIGTIIIKIQVFTKDGKQDSSLEITGSSDMPSMRVLTPQRISRSVKQKGDYLLPVNVVMPGDWECSF